VYLYGGILDQSYSLFFNQNNKNLKFLIPAKPIPTNLYHCRHFVAVIWINVSKTLEHPLHQPK